jgi:hypothetical protein
MDLQVIVRHIIDNLYEIPIKQLNNQQLRDYIMKQCIGYPEIAYNTCSLIAERYPKYSREIADLVFKNNF